MDKLLLFFISIEAYAAGGGYGPSSLIPGLINTVLVGVKRIEILDDRIVLEAKIFSENQNRLVAICKQHIVSYDYKRRMKAPIPLNWAYNDNV